MIRRLAKVLLLSVLGCTLVLSSSLAFGTPVYSKNKIVYYYNWSGGNHLEAMFMELVEEFERLHPNIEVEMIRGGSVGGQNAVTRLIALIASGNAPDVAHFERSTIIEFAAKGLLTPLDHHMDSIEEDYLPGALQEVMYQGAVYGVPWGTDIRGLFWNQADFEESGLNKDLGPQTMEELDEMAAKLTRLDPNGAFDRVGFVPWLGNWSHLGWLYTFGGAVYDPMTNQPRVNSENHIRAFGWIESYAQRYPRSAVTVAIQGRPATTFYGRKVSMFPQWNGFGRLIEDADPSIDYWVGEVPHPPYGSNGTWMGGFSHVIPAGAANPEAALTFLKWISGDDGEIKRFRQGGAWPTRWSALRVITDELTATDAILARQTEVAWGRPPLWHPPLYQTLSEALNRVTNLQASPKEALDEAQRRLEILYRETLGE